MVLTQLRMMIAANTLKWQSFHYGSYATYTEKGDRLPVLDTFPYHYGSYATPSCRKSARGGRAFPYHYGSYATGSLANSRLEPTRFPYHYGSYATI